MFRLSPNLKFLKNAMSLLKSDGIRTELRGIFPICPNPVALVKQAVLITNAEPVTSAPLASFTGSQIVFERALPVPPVKSVIMVHTVAEVWIEPGGHV